VTLMKPEPCTSARDDHDQRPFRCSEPAGLQSAALDSSPISILTFTWQESSNSTQMCRAQYDNGIILGHKIKIVGAVSIVLVGYYFLEEIF
jgi:hypothetical protein